MAIKFKQTKYALITGDGKKIVTGNRTTQNLVPIDEIKDSSKIYMFGNEKSAQQRCKMMLAVGNWIDKDFFKRENLFVIELHCDYTII